MWRGWRATEDVSQCPKGIPQELPQPQSSPSGLTRGSMLRINRHHGAAESARGWILGSSPRMTVLVERMTRHGGCITMPRGDAPRVAPASIVTLGLDPRVHAEDQPAPWRGGERMGVDPRVKPEDDVPCGGGISARLSQLSDCPVAKSARSAGRRWQVPDSRPGPTGRHGCGRFPATASGAQAPAPSRRRGGPATPPAAPWR